MYNYHMDAERNERYMYPKKLIAAVLAALLTVSLASCGGAKGDKLAKEGKELYSEGSYSNALVTFLKAEENGVKNFKTEELYSCIGNCYFQLDDYDKSIEYHTKCLEENPEYFDGWVNLGVAYRSAGNNEKAMTCYEVALNYDPENEASLQLYISLGALYIELGKPISAITYLEKAEDIRNDIADVYAYLSIAYAMALEPEKSDTAYSKARSLGYPNMNEVQEQLDKIANRE